jgi:hypothetical protein
MDLKDLRENFHEIDRKISSNFHKEDKITGEKKISGGKVLILFLALVIIGFFAFTTISGLVYNLEPSEQTSLSLNTAIANIGDKTNFTIHGQTNIGANVTISSEELNLSSVPVKVDENGKFEYTIKVPSNVESATVYVSAKAEGKDSVRKYIDIKRDTPEIETTTTDTTTSDSTSTNNFDGKGVVKFIDSGLLTGNFMYIDVEIDGVTKEFAINGAFKSKIKEGDTIYFNYGKTYVDDGMSGKYPVIIPVNSDGSEFKY